mmetsp:Transcript_17917/g.25521  ORF Transcript_17917/g.25521 Transcript_17917/m.25521 type:complete len:267 (-) Transcript_17917:590-1390(-)
MMENSNRNSTTTTSREEALRRMTKLVSSFMARADCAPFREPVDWRGLELWDYPKIIKKMMDLGTIKRKLDSHKYATAFECAEDVRLVWSNCKTYNADGSDFFLIAESLSKRFEERYRKIKAEFDTGDEDLHAGSGRAEGDDSGGALQASPSAPPLDVRTKFASNLFRLNGDELGYVLQVLDLRCPHVIENIAPAQDDEPHLLNKKEKDMQAEINVDAIDSKTFADLDRFVKEKLYTRDSTTHHSSSHHHSSSSTTAGTSEKKRKTK